MIRYPLEPDCPVAKNLGLNVGDTFYSAHGLKDQSVVHEDRVYCCRILNPSETVDQPILYIIKSILDIHKEEGEEHDSQDQEITAMLVKLAKQMGQVFLSNAIENKDMQVAILNIEMEKLEQNSGLARRCLSSNRASSSR